MLKVFLLLLIYESGAGQTALYHMEFSSRQACDAAKVAVTAKARQLRPASSVVSEGSKTDSKPAEVLKLIDATCLEK